MNVINEKIYKIGEDIFRYEENFILLIQIIYDCLNNGKRIRFQINIDDYYIYLKGSDFLQLKEKLIKNQNLDVAFIFCVKDNSKFKELNFQYFIKNIINKNKNFKYIQ